MRERFLHLSVNDALWFSLLQMNSIFRLRDKISTAPVYFLSALWLVRDWYSLEMFSLDFIARQLISVVVAIFSSSFSIVDAPLFRREDIQIKRA
jgi:hypothetical protein